MSGEDHLCAGRQGGDGGVGPQIAAANADTDEGRALLADFIGDKIYRGYQGLRRLRQVEPAQHVTAGAGPVVQSAGLAANLGQGGGELFRR